MSRPCSGKERRVIVVARLQVHAPLVLFQEVFDALKVTFLYTPAGEKMRSCREKYKYIHVYTHVHVVWDIPTLSASTYGYGEVTEK